MKEVFVITSQFDNDFLKSFEERDWYHNTPDVQQAQKYNTYGEAAAMINNNLIRVMPGRYWGIKKLFTNV